MDAWYYGISVACDTMEFEIIFLSPPLVWSTLLAFPGDVTYACTNIQQVTEEEGDTPHIDTWRNVRVRIDFVVVCIMTTFMI